MACPRLQHSGVAALLLCTMICQGSRDDLEDICAQAGCIPMLQTVALT